MFNLPESLANAAISQILLDNFFDSVIEVVLTLKLIQFTVNLAAEIVEDTLIDTLRCCGTH